MSTWIRVSVLLLMAVACSAYARHHHNVASNCHHGHCQVSCPDHSSLCSTAVALTQKEGFFKVDPAYFYCTATCDGMPLERDGVTMKLNTNHGHLGICGTGDGVVTSTKQLNKGFMVARITRESRDMSVTVAVKKVLCPSQQLAITCQPGTGGRGKVVMSSCN